MSSQFLLNDFFRAKRALHEIFHKFLETMQESIAFLSLSILQMI